ncbi:MAG: shikimate dehydrogenase [Tepidanaerobacteraceae bacterium]|jgi:shikimate dehydrogenase
MVKIDAKTRIIGLLGHPLGHSFSPAMQNAAFEFIGLNKLYIPIEVTPNNLGDVVKGISKMNFDGFNVTKPYKVNIIKYLDEVDDLAKIIGAVNVVTIKNGILKGYNTDGNGFIRSFEEEIGISVDGKNIFIIGSGGASRAISMTLAIKGAKTICICNRTYEKAVDLSEDINKNIKRCSIPITMNCSDMENALDDIDIIINTTSVGMFPDTEKIPIDEKLLHKRFIVSDIVYNPRKTKLLKAAEKKGCKTVSGLAMLVYQGAESFKLWTDMEPPVEKMFNAINDL